MSSKLTKEQNDKYMMLMGDTLKLQRTPEDDFKTVNHNTKIEMSQTGFEKLMGAESGKGLYWTTDINAELPIKMGNDGVSANLKPITLS